MARTQKRIVETDESFDIPPVPAAVWDLAPSPLRTADGSFEAIDSPARALQAQLAASFAEPQVDNRWSARRSLAVITFGSLAGWAALIAVARVMFF